MIDVKKFGHMTNKQKAKYLKTLSQEQFIVLYYAVKRELSEQSGEKFAECRNVHYGHVFAECKQRRQAKKFRNTASTEHAGRIGQAIKERRFPSAVVAYRSRNIY